MAWGEADEGWGGLSKRKEVDHPFATLGTTTRVKDANGHRTLRTLSIYKRKEEKEAS